jgi:hypothetical protein
MLASRAERTRGHHLIAGRPSEPQARSSPLARQGRSEAEWLDRAEDRRTISHRDGRTLERRLCSARQRTRRTRRARLGNSQEVTAGAASGGDSAEVRVHLYERSFPEEPDRHARAVNVNDVRTALDTGAAFGGVTGIAPSRRTIVTCMWGVSDPLRAGRGAKKGAAKWGSLTPRWSSGGSDSDPESVTGGTERRRRPAGGCSRARTSSIDNRQLRDARHRFPERILCHAGERCSRVLVPRPCSPFRVQTRATREGKVCPRDSRAYGC